MTRQTHLNAHSIAPPCPPSSDSEMVSKAATRPVRAARHVMALPQLQTHFRVQAQWFWSYVTGQRSSRLISEAPRPIDVVEQKALP